MQNVVFYFRRKTGIKMTDLGLADVVFDGEGLTVSFLSFIYIVVKQRSRKLYTLPSISFLQAKIERRCSSSPSGTRSMTCYTKPSSHSPPLSSRNRSRGSITTGMGYVDGQLVGVRDSMAGPKARVAVRCRRK
jgi:hypothetical protein